MVLRRLLVALIAFLASVNSRAEVISYSYYTPDFDFVWGAGARASVPLKGTAWSNRSEVVYFNVKTAGYVKVTFAAECMVNMSGTPDKYTAWIDLDIVIDGSYVSPGEPPTAGNIDAFCGAKASVADGGAYSLTHPSITIVKSLPVGTHNVRIYMRTNGSPGGTVPGTIAWGVSQSSLTIER